MEHEKKPKKHSVVWKIILFLGIAVVVAGLVILGLAFNLLNRLNRDDPTTFSHAEDDIILADPTASPTPTLAPATPGPTPEPTPQPTPLPLSDVYSQTNLTADQVAKMEADRQNDQYINILLIGVDRRNGNGLSNTDTMMIATIDKQNNRLKLTSLMRDMLVNIPGYGYAKLNTAAVKGGVELLMQTINEAFYLNISEYVLVDFNMFQEIIDSLGGITVEMTTEEISAANDCIAGLNKQLGVADPWDGFIFAGEGNVKLTGKQALGYARVRKIDSDFSRINRQFNVLNAAFAVFKNAGLKKQYSLLDKIVPLVETNISNTRIIECAVSALSLDANGLLHLGLPVDGCYKNGTYKRSSVLFSDIPANALALHAFIFDSTDAAKAAEVLKPGPSLPPRTPTPTNYNPYPYLAEGNYYYSNGIRYEFSETTVAPPVVTVSPSE